MAKDTLVIWGGNGRELALENLDSHASVTAYFLSKYLSKYYDIVNLVHMDRPEELLGHLDTRAMLSTFQYGFTSRIVRKGKRDLFMEIRRRFQGKLCSVIDRDSVREYYEDVLFTVLPPAPHRRRIIRWRSLNKNIAITRMGWCADPVHCFPEEVPDNQVNVFVDHPPYATDAPDFTPHYWRAFQRLSGEESGIPLNVYQQSNRGVDKWDWGGHLSGGVYVRSNKVPWLTMIEHYRRSHVFCATHPESAGLAVIEAAMCGAKIYVPVHRIRSTFISSKLLGDDVPVTTLRHGYGFGDTSDRIAKAFKRDLARGFDRQASHQRLSQSNSWASAAKTIHSEISKEC